MQAPPPVERLEPRRLMAASVGGLFHSGVGILSHAGTASLTATRTAPATRPSAAIRARLPFARGLPLVSNWRRAGVPISSDPAPSAPDPGTVTSLPATAPDVMGFALLDAATELPLATPLGLTNGSILNLAALSTRTLNIQALLNAKGRSVAFTLDGNVRIDNYASFTARPLRSEAGYTTWTPTVGRHTLTAQAFSGPDATGIAGAAQTITFDVIDIPPDPYAGRPVPSPGGSRYIVDPAGPIKTIAQAAGLAHAGDVVLIAPGSYHETLRLTNSGTADRPITFAPITPGTVTLDGAGFGYILRGSVAYIHLQEMTFDHAANTVQSAAVEVSTGWELTDCIIQNTDGQGLVVYGDGAVLTRVIAQYNGEEGISGSNCTNVLLTDCTTRYNNNGKANPVWKNDSHAILLNGLYYVDTSWQAGAGKWVKTDHVTLDGVQSYGNHGTGIWFDYNNTNAVIRNCTVHDNTPVTNSNFWEGVGISIEVCTGPVLLQNNTVYNQIGGDIVIASSRGVTLTGNSLTGGYIALNDWDRGVDYTLRNLDFHNNTFTDVFLWTGGDNWTPASGSTKNIRFDHDTWTYHTTQLAIWNNVYYYTPTSLRQQLGLELNGTFIHV